MHKNKEIILVDKVDGFRIYDTVENSFIGFRLGLKEDGPIKSIWNKAHHAKSAFRHHTGIFYNEQSRYVIFKSESQISTKVE